MTVKQKYHNELAARGYQADPAQLRAIQALNDCAREWAHFREKRSNAFKKLINRPPLPRGVYMYGGVGRGKSFLMDCFYEAVPLRRKTRLHFHEFMREVHRELALMKGTVNPLNMLAKRMAKKYRLICFDEFHVSDVVDAMILHRLLEALCEQGVGFVTTSNFKPDELYPNGLHRDRILPAIALLNARLNVINVDNGTDYRGRDLAQVELYHTPLGEAADQAMRQAYERLAEQADEAPQLQIEGRALEALRRAGGVVWFDFRTLCGSARSQNDYLELATRFHTLLLSDVPRMTPQMSAQARRFTWLIDVLYDRRVKLVMSAQVPAEALYTEGQMANEFVRTVSRIQEMQSADFFAMARRDVVTDLT